VIFNEQLEKNKSGPFLRGLLSFSKQVNGGVAGSGPSEAKEDPVDLRIASSGASPLYNCHRFQPTLFQTAEVLPKIECLQYKDLNQDEFQNFREFHRTARAGLPIISLLRQRGVDITKT